jgi:SAM-dependent methyltransferase
MVDKETCGEIEAGNLICGKCQRVFPIVRSIPRFVGSDEYAKNFTYEWRAYPTLQYGKESEEVFQTKTGFDVLQLDGKLVLDVGCGSGRFLDVVSRFGAEAVGFDLSYSVDAAFEAIGRRRNVHLVQADLFRPPFKDGSFDLVYSIGVLPSTPSPQVAFSMLPKLLKRGGTVAVWVYVKWQQSGDGSTRIRESTTKLYRKITTRLPMRFLHHLCYASIPLYHLKRPPIIGTLLSLALVTSSHPNWKWRVLDTFDWYAPKYQFRHTSTEVTQWFREAGLTDVRILAFPVSVSGRRIDHE